MRSNSFVLNDILWVVELVPPNSQELIDRTGALTLGTTDPVTKKIFLNQMLRGPLLCRVFLHELGHCAMISFDLIEKVHQVVYPEYWIEAEEWLCNYLFDYGFMIFTKTYSILGYKVLELLPKELEDMIRKEVIL